MIESRKVNDMPEKVFIGDDGKVTFICPECKRSKTTHASNYKHSETAVKVNCKCACGHAYSVLLERRKYIRKNLNLRGIYYLMTRDERGMMTVIDMSRSGMKIRLEVERSLALGERLALEFRLDDKEKSLIRREVFIRSVKGALVGVEFCHPEHYDKLGHYIAWQFS